MAIASSCWLFKAEPHVYGINHLAAEPNQVGRWDGIRNYQGRNFLRDQVRKGDIVFLYHSSCKEIGIVGIAKIVKALTSMQNRHMTSHDGYLLIFN
jgi:predicted RNA-binding protein with PUA-like domain